jgi:integrase
METKLSVFKGGAMATIRKRGDYQWEAQIRRKGHPNLSKTFEIRADAEDWARDIERDMRRGLFTDRREADSTTLLVMLEKYEEEVTPDKKSAARELTRIARWKKHKLASHSLTAIKPRDISAFISERRKLKLAENTIRLDIALISSVFEKCRTKWGIPINNPCRDVELPKGSNKRERRLSSTEESTLLEYIAKAMPKTAHIQALIRLELETGMRQSEMIGVEWNDVHIEEKYIHLDDTKSGDPRNVPLSPKALKIIAEITRPEKNARVFKVTQDALVRGFKRACLLAISAQEKPKAGFMENLSFHDLRHEAASRWAEHLEAHELCKMFGWKTMQMALRYYHPTATSLADKLARALS